MSSETPLQVHHEVEEKEEVVIRFCGDSGDGMQVTGSRFTQTTAILGNDLATLPDYPAEIRAPAGSLAGVSGYQIAFSSRDIKTPGDAPDVLVAMNPAALKTNLLDLKEGGILIVNSDAFIPANLEQAGYSSNPLEDNSLVKYRIHQIPISTLNAAALQATGLGRKDVERCKNFFALGLMFWLYDRPMEDTIAWVKSKFANKIEIADANIMALKGGYNFGETTDMFKKSYRVAKAKLPQGTYRHITGNEATALGCIAAGQLAKKELIYSTYPITPASDILHELSKHKNYGVKTLQAEDEIAAMGMTIGASFAGALSFTGTSGPGLALKSEALSLALMMELPLVVVNVQRGGPSTGLPTKTEQSDLLQAYFGRHGEAPLPIVAPATSSDCFEMAIEAFRMAVKYMTPVIYLSDGYLANGAEPWLVPDVSKMAPIESHHPQIAEGFKPYARNEKTLARPWAIPGTPGLEHRLGGLEKQDVTGTVSYDSNNHERMIHLRAAKIAGMVQDVPAVKAYGEPSGDVLIIGWGSTYGAITTAVERMQKEGMKISSIHLRYLNPLPQNLGDVISKFKKVIIPEMNMGQLAMILRAHYLVDAQSLTKVKGQPFKIQEIIDGIKSILLK
ncbi:MAG: hypothetical protein ACD_73C00286G0003 [uncultured bacterium]|nr:MAG: hypothetical protein ACD_73C00286G0003 [uncultured bacterium]